jgi:8-amino-7-oxononanoate synthase
MTGLDDWLGGKLRSLEHHDLLRRLRRNSRADIVPFCGNDYLDLSHDPRVIEAATQALREHGAGSRGSRLMAGQLCIHEELEAELADFLKVQRVLVFSSGYAANVGLLSSLLGKTDAVVADALNHASLIDGVRLCGAEARAFEHVNSADAARHLRKLAAKRHRLVLSDGLFSMDGDIAPLAELARLATEHDAWFAVDDAHGLGVLGKQGRGACELLQIENAVDIRTGTLSKALGAQGGFVAGSAVLIESLVQRARSFVYSTGLAPASAAAAREALRILRSEPERRAQLGERVQRLRQGLAALGLPVPKDATPIVPIRVGTPSAALAHARALEEEGFLVTAIRPPTVPTGTSRLRISLSTAHRLEDIDRLLDALARTITIKRGAVSHA